MKARIQKWGNSLALRIPKSLAEEVHVHLGTQVDVLLVDGSIVVKPVNPPEWTLDDLLRGITEENLHSEIDSGPFIGKEVW